MNDYIRYLEETLELFKSDIGSVLDLFQLPFRTIQVLREARVKRYKEEADRQEKMRKEQERQQRINQIMKK